MNALKQVLPVQPNKLLPFLSALQGRHALYILLL